MTPPVGACLFVLSSVTGEKIEKITMSLWPFLLLEVAVLLMVAYFDKLTMWMPNLLLGISPP
jgi:TRAP-type C4-dicarboxylate transport system permease large subunit